MERELVNRIVTESERARSAYGDSAVLSNMVVRSQSDHRRNQETFFRNVKSVPEPSLESVVRKVVTQELARRKG